MAFIHIPAIENGIAINGLNFFKDQNEGTLAGLIQILLLYGNKNLPKECQIITIIVSSFYSFIPLFDKPSMFCRRNQELATQGWKGASALKEFMTQWLSTMLTHSYNPDCDQGNENNLWGDGSEGFWIWSGYYIQDIISSLWKDLITWFYMDWVWKDFSMLYIVNVSIFFKVWSKMIGVKELWTDSLVKITAKKPEIGKVLYYGPNPVIHPSEMDLSFYRWS